MKNEMTAHTNCTFTYCEFTII